MRSLILSLSFFVCLVSEIYGFRALPASKITVTSTSLSPSSADVNCYQEAVDVFRKASLLLSDSSVSDDDVLVATGQVSELPDPAFAIVFAAMLLIGIGALQFSLGDLTKAEGQARVKDYLATRRDTERKRGYFDRSKR